MTVILKLDNKILVMKEKIKNYLSKIKNKKILIQGLGLNGGGVGSALFFLKNGFNVTITDLKSESVLEKSIIQLSKYNDKITYILGEHREIDFKNADIVIKGPGVPPTNKFIKIAEENGTYVTSDIEIFFEIAPCKIYAITGSKGKSTTVSAIYSIFKENNNENAFMGGNITISPLSFYDKLNKDSLVILELSSWQLRDLKNKNFHIDGCAITNLLNDHQNYYSSMIDYLNDKIIITNNQTVNDFCILPYDDNYLNTKNIKTEAKIYYYSNDNQKSNFYYDGKYSFFEKGKRIISLYNIKDIQIPGEHIKINILLAGAFCYLAGIDLRIIRQGIKNFKGIPFRLELIREWNGIKFYNDTTATIPDASYNALKSFNEPIIWIAGGSDKNLDFSILKEIVNKPKKILLLNGDGSEKMKKILNRDDIIQSNSLEILFNEAIKLAIPGDIILLSPGCTSFGLFQNEFHRGEIFNYLVNNL